MGGEHLKVSPQVSGVWSVRPSALSPELVPELGGGEGHGACVPPSFFLFAARRVPLLLLVSEEVGFQLFSLPRRVMTFIMYVLRLVYATTGRFVLCLC